MGLSENQRKRLGLEDYLATKWGLDPQIPLPIVKDWIEESR